MMKYITKSILASLLLQTSMVAIVAAEDADARRPLGCKDVGYQFELKILRLLPLETADQQSLYLIFNTDSKPVNLYQMRGEDSTRSIYMNEPEVRYICTMNDDKSNYGKVVDCGETLKVCEYARVKYGMNNRGNYWLVNGNTNTGAVYEVLHYGIIPR